jgi:cell division initiation protein
MERVEMSITAQDIQNQVFERSRHGYDAEQVDEFLERVANEISVLVASRDELARANADFTNQLNSRVAADEAKFAEYEQKLAKAGDMDNTISKAFISAQRSADALKEEARAEGEKVYREAEAKSREILRDALSEKQHTLEDVDRLKDSRERFRTEYLTLLHQFMKQAEQVFPEGVDTQADVSSQSEVAPQRASHPTHVTADATASSPAATIAAPAVPHQTSTVTSYGDTAEFDLGEID